MARRAQQRGFTLVEVLVALVIIGILAAIAVPNFLSWLPNMQLKAAANDFRTNMQKAKVEAVKRNANVVVLLDSAACPGVSGSGYQIFVDNGAGGGTAKDRVHNGSEPIIADVVMPRDAMYCTDIATGKTGFRPNGLVIESGGITLSNTKGRSYQLTLTIAGGVRLQ